jgi:hypothetical protein
MGILWCCSIPYCQDLGMCVTTDGVRNADCIYWPLIHPQIFTILYRVLKHTAECLQSLTVSTNRILVTVFNTGTITLSLNYTFQISHIMCSLHRCIVATNPALHSFTYRTHSQLNWVKSKSKLLYDWRFTANQFALASSPARPTTTNFLQQNRCGPQKTPFL